MLIERRAFLIFGIAFLLVAFLVVMVRLKNGPDRRAIQEIDRRGGWAYTDHVDLPDWVYDWITEVDPYALARVQEVWFCQSSFESKAEYDGVDSNYMVPITSDIGDAGIAGLVPYLRPLKDLQVLVLSGTGITDKGLRDIGQLRTLTQLNLDATGISDAGLDHLSQLQNLESLSLWITDISDEGLEKLYVLRKLTFVDLRQTHVTAEGIRKLQKALPKVRVWSNRS